MSGTVPAPKAFGHWDGSLAGRSSLKEVVGAQWSGTDWSTKLQVVPMSREAELPGGREKRG